MLNLPKAPTFQIVNWRESKPLDARTELLNLGLSVCEGQYVGFLDYDDILYPEAYELLVDRLIKTQAAIAFASVRVINAEIQNNFICLRNQVVPNFHGNSLCDLFRANFCPIHSYLIDRSKIEQNALKFDTNLTWEEDYELLLRICSAYKSDFGLLNKLIGDYYYKTDGSNTVTGAWSAQRRFEYERVSAQIEIRRETTLVALPVQQSLGISPNRPELTISDVLNKQPHPNRFCCLFRWLEKPWSIINESRL
jgi:hypothetical protein